MAKSLLAVIVPLRVRNPRSPLIPAHGVPAPMATVSVTFPPTPNGRLASFA